MPYAHSFDSFEYVRLGMYVDSIMSLKMIFIILLYDCCVRAVLLMREMPQGLPGSPMLRLWAHGAQKVSPAYPLAPRAGEWPPDMSAGGAERPGTS